MIKQSASRWSLGLLLVIVVLLASVIPAAAGGNPRANGGGTTQEGGETSTFTFNAVMHKDGSVNGHLQYQFRLGGFNFHMDIDCLSITGNRATLGGVVTSVSGDVGAYTYVVVGARAAFTVLDNGQGHGAAPDLISDVIFGSGSCSSVFTPYLPISGNLQVNS